MPWPRKDPDPLEARRRLLAEQERQLAEQRERLREQLHGARDSSGANAKPAELPVWRMEEDVAHRPAAEPTPARRRNLARQRQRDMILFFICIGLLLVVLIVIMWIAYVHNAASVAGA